MQQPEMPEHTILIKCRKSALLEGVREVVLCDGKVLEAELDNCRVVIRGTGIRIEDFDSAKGRLSLVGAVDSAEYLNGRIKGATLFQRLFR